MKTTFYQKNTTLKNLNDFQFSDIFNLEDIQRIQDLFADAHGVASIITYPDGTPITKPSNFCRLCNIIIRKTEKGCTNCYQSDAVIGKYNSSGPILQPCLSSGLLDAGASITIGGKHIANWLIGQVRNDEVDEQRMKEYAVEIGANSADFMEALNEVPVMSMMQFGKISKILFAFANELSEKAYNNLQLKMQISERRHAELLIKEKNKHIEAQNEKYIQINKELVLQNEENEKRAAELIIANKELVFQVEEKEKRAAELVIANDHAAESDKLKTAFLNNISHEIRTPFNGLLGFLSLIQDNDLPESERDEYIGIINKSADRLMNTINDIVEMSQIQAGQMKLTVSNTNIRRLTSELYSSFKTEAESKGLKLFINNDLPISIENIYTDKIKLNSILTILIGNAIKFTNAGSIVFGIKFSPTQPTGGSPTEIANGDIGIDDDCRDKTCLITTNAELEFSVKDTGIGIPKNKQQAVFERFAQVDISNTRQFEGSGLGLSIAEAYVEMIGGNIWVESEVGKGSVFYFTIPYNVEPEEKNGVKNIVAAEGAENQINHEDSGLKILIAEDDEESTKLLALTVKPFGKEIISVRTGAKAVEVCRNNPDIDLVLMDIKMPEMNGYEATRQIRQFNNDVVIIAQTAYALTGDREKAIKSGCNDYITKPFKKDHLMLLVHEYFKK